MKVAVIGAGPTGLPAIKCCLGEGFDVVCFEQRDDIGGLWNYKEEAEEGLGIVMRGTVTNTFKEMMGFSDFPIPKDFPLYLPHPKLLEYYHTYVDHFQLRNYIRFSTEVTRVRQTKDFAKTGRWEVTSKDLQTGSTSTEVYDAVMVCNGHDVVPHRPRFDNEANFQGEILHSHEYRHNEIYKNKRAVVVGFQSSGCDIAGELADVCSQVYLSIRSGAWVITRVWGDGQPWESHFMTRRLALMSTFLPQAFIFRKMRQWVQEQFDHDLHGIRPDYEVGQDYPCVTDVLPGKLINGTVKIRPEIRRLTSTGVEFVDGSTVDDIDVIVCATGYDCSFPFMEHEAFNIKTKNDVNFYNNIFPPDIQPPTIAAIGLLDVPAGYAAQAELTSRYAAAVFKGSVKLPDADTMRRSVAAERESCKSVNAVSPRQFIKRDPIVYSDRLAAAIGCKPPGFLRLLLTDPKLAKAIYLGPFTWLPYRLVGPGAWPGARDAVIGISDRLRYPYPGGRTARQKPNGNGLHPLLAVAAAGFVLIAVLFVILMKA